jgi:hypothetical protein
MNIPQSTEPETLPEVNLAEQTYVEPSVQPEVKHEAKPEVTSEVKPEIQAEIHSEPESKSKRQSKKKSKVAKEKSPKVLEEEKKEEKPQVYDIATVSTLETEEDEVLLPKAIFPEPQPGSHRVVIDLMKNRDVGPTY